MQHALMLYICMTVSYVFIVQSFHNIFIGQIECFGKLSRYFSHFSRVKSKS